MKRAAQQLFQVFKDHNIPAIQEMVHCSNLYSYTNTGNETFDDDRDLEPFRPLHFPALPCRLVVVNTHEFGERLDVVSETLRSDGVLLDVSLTNVSVTKPTLSSNASDVTSTINDIQEIMNFCDHRYHSLPSLPVLR